MPCKCYPSVPCSRKGSGLGGVWSRGGLVPGGLVRGGVWSQGGAWSQGGLVSGGCLVPAGGCLVPGGSGPGGDVPGLGGLQAHT